MSNQETDLPANKKVNCPCPYMIFDDKFHYHECALLLSKDSDGTTSHCVCPGLFYDISGDLYSAEFDGTGIVTEDNFPDIAREKAKTRMTEDDVPRLCPKGYTAKQVQAKAEALDPWLAQINDVEFQKATMDEIKRFFEKREEELK